MKTRKLTAILLILGAMIVACRQQVPAATPSPTSAPQVVPPTPLPTEQPVSPTATNAPTATSAPSPTPTAPAPGLAPLPVSAAISIHALRMFDASNGWAVAGIEAAEDHLAITNDGGNTWYDHTPPQPAPAGGQLNVIAAFLSQQTAWAFFYNPEPAPVEGVHNVWRTQDGGRSWQTSQPLDSSGLVETFYPSHLQFVDERAGWLLVHVGVGMNHDYVVLYRTQDGGETWQRLIDPTSNDGGIQACYKTGMQFTDAQNGWLTGDCNGVAAGVLFYSTQDGGQTWQSVALPPPPDKPGQFEDFTMACGSYSPDFLDANSGKVAVQCINQETEPREIDYYLYQTDDGGTRWSSNLYPGGTLYFLDDQNGWALGREIYQTQDGGVTWLRISTVSWDAQFSFLDGQLGWAAARSEDQFGLVRTTNGGRSWELLNPRAGTP